jgi:hypothetical protein
MRRLVLIGFALVLAAPMRAAQVQQVTDESIAVKFVVDGQPVACKDLKVKLSLGAKRIPPVPLSGGFLVPKEILDAYASKSLHIQNDVSAEVTCDERTVSESGLYPAQVLPGQWEVGIAYPTTWFDSPSGAPKQGAWVSYIVTECNGCDPGIVVSQVHSDVPALEILQLQTERGRNAERERDVAYALSVFASDYQANRDRLVKTLSDCLKRPPNSPEDDVCDERLVQYISNLYWRGDNEMLHLLFGIAQRREDVVDGAGEFYADLLNRRLDVAISELSSIPVEKQLIVCTMAFDNDLRFDSIKLARVESGLRAGGTEVGQRCLEALQNSKP